MNSEDRDAALKEIAKVPLVLAEDYFLSLIVLTADFNGAKEVFWDIWEKLYAPLKQLMVDDFRPSLEAEDQVMITYLLGSRLWKQGVNEWQHFDKRGIDLFECVSKEFPPSLPLALGFSSFADSIGRKYWRKTLRWISKAISFSSSQSFGFGRNFVPLVHLLESVMCYLVAEHRTEIRKNSDLYNNAFVIVDFLVSQYSIVGYRLKETLT